MSSTRKKADEHESESEGEMEVKDAKEIRDDFVEEACAEFRDDIVEEVFEWQPLLQYEEGHQAQLYRLKEI